VIYVQRENTHKSYCFLSFAEVLSIFRGTRRLQALIFALCSKFLITAEKKKKEYPGP
jgi:hypothetical protein